MKMLLQFPLLRRLAWPAGMTLALLCVGVLLLLRNYGAEPSVFADEWYYSKMARLMPIADAILPSYLYLWVFRPSLACGDAFLECVRVGNLAFFMASAPFLYLITRRYASRPVAFLVALLGTLAPLNIFTAYFMPEVMYYFGFCVLSWVALCGGAWRAPVHALVTGLVLGVMSQVKVHALFLLPALCLFLLAASHARGGAWFLRGIGMALLAAAATFALKFGLGWLFAGDAGLSLFGYFYGSTKLQTDRLAQLSAAALSASGHLMTLAVMYGLPLAILVHGLRLRTPAGTPDERGLMHVYVLLMLGAAGGLTVFYTAGLAVGGEYEGLRLHLRYYSFVFPLLAVVAAAAAGTEPDAGEARARLRWALALLVGAALLASLFKLQIFRTNMADSPDIAGIGLARGHFAVLVGLQLLLLLAWAARLRMAPLLYLCLALPAVYAASQVGIGRYMAAMRTPSPTDVAARFARDHVPPAERGQVVIAGVDISLMMRAQFHLDHPDTVWRVIDFGPIAEHQLPVNKKWLLLLGQYQVPDTVDTILRTPDYAFVRLPDPEPTVSRALLSEPLDPKVVTHVEGLSHIEAWGRWSDAKRVVIHFARPLPRRAGVVLTARAFDVNAKLPFRMTVGKQVKEFRAGWHDGEMGLRFDTDGEVRSIEIEVPQPVSPAERGNPGDTRTLGIGITEITITDGAGQRG